LPRRLSGRAARCELRNRARCALQIMLAAIICSRG
jgi:hypothetical protein